MHEQQKNIFLPAGSRRNFYILSENFSLFSSVRFSITDRRKNYLRNIIVNKCEKVQSDLTLFQFFSSKANFIVAKRWGTFVRILLSSGFL